jgi:RNA polymerase sigma factor (sigma-70 family)
MPGMTKQLDSSEKLAQMSLCITDVADNRDKAAFARLFDHYAPLIRAYSLARNCRIDYLRRNSRYVTEIDPTDIFNDMEYEGPGPFQLVQQSRVEENIRAGLKQLPREQSEILTKVYLEGKSHQQASDELKLPLGTVKSRVRLALKKLEVLVPR